MIHHGDCLRVMAEMDSESVDAIVTDPPYGLEFMGKEWDRLWSEPDDSFTVRPKGGSSPFNRRRAGYGTDSRAMQSWHQRWAEAAYRVAKPSAYLLAFGGTRTVHRMMVALEDAGWIIRDMLVWAYASGFPKSRASLKPSWEPIVLARKPGPLRNLNIEGCRIGVETMPQIPGELGAHGVYGRMVRRSVSGPTTTMDEWDDAANLCVSCAVDAENPERLGASVTRGSTTRRPAELSLTGAGSFGGTSRAATGCSHGMTPANGASSSSTDESGRTPTGLFHPDTLSTISTKTSSITGSRTCTCCGGQITPTTTSATPFDTETGQPAPTISESTASVGRWPPNLLLTDPIFDGGVEGVVGGGEGGAHGGPPTRAASNGYGGYGDAGDSSGYGDSGTYSRFFLLPKADRSDREPIHHARAAEPGSAGRRTPHPDLREPVDGIAAEQLSGTGAGFLTGAPFEGATIVETPRRVNVHPTVKPTELMRHLVRLVTPPGGTVLDPFLGSGTTGLACELEGFPWIGIEKEAEYVAIAEARLNGTQRGLGLDVPAPTQKRETTGRQGPDKWERRAPKFQGTYQEWWGDVHPFTCGICRDAGKRGPESEWATRDGFTAHMNELHSDELSA